MPSMRARKQRGEKRNDEVDRHTFTAALEQFKKDGTGSRIDEELIKQFPLFHGKAPAGHPYPDRHGFLLSL